MTFNSIADIDNHLSYLSKSALEQVARYVGVSRFYAMNMEQLRGSILAIAKGEVAPLPIYKRNIRNPKPYRNEDLFDAVMVFSEANLKQLCIDEPVNNENEMSYHSVADIEEGLATLTKYSLEIISCNVGVARSYALNKEQLRAAILAIAKADVAPLPIKKSHICNVFSQNNQKIIDAVLALSEANLK